MLFFIWNGRGGLVLITMIVGLFASATAAHFFGFQDGTASIVALELVIAILFSIPIWIYGKKWNAESRTLIDKASGQEFTITNQNTCFWIPMQYWAFIY